MKKFLLAAAACVLAIGSSLAQGQTTVVAVTDYLNGETLNGMQIKLNSFNNNAVHKWMTLADNHTLTIGDSKETAVAWTVEYDAAENGMILSCDGYYIGRMPLNAGDAIPTTTNKAEAGRYRFYTYTEGKYYGLSCTKYTNGNSVSVTQFAYYGTSGGNNFIQGNNSIIRWGGYPDTSKWAYTLIDDNMTQESAEAELEAYKAEKRSRVLANNIITESEADEIFANITIPASSDNLASDLLAAKTKVDNCIEPFILSKINGKKVRFQSAAGAQGGSTLNFMFGKPSTMIHHKDFSLDAVWEINVDENGYFTMKNLVNNNYASGTSVTANEENATHYALVNAFVCTAGTFAIENTSMTAEQRYLNNNQGSGVTGNIQYRKAGWDNYSSFWWILPVTEEEEQGWLQEIKDKLGREIEIDTKPGTFYTTDNYETAKAAAEALTMEMLYTPTAAELYSTTYYFVNPVTPGVLVRIKNHNNTYFTLNQTATSFVDEADDSTVFYYTPEGHLVSLAHGLAASTDANDSHLLNVTDAEGNADLATNAKSVFFDLAPTYEPRYHFNFNKVTKNGNNTTTTKRYVYNDGGSSVSGGEGVTVSTDNFHNYTYSVELVESITVTFNEKDQVEGIVCPVALTLSHQDDVTYYTCVTERNADDELALSFSPASGTVAPNTPLIIKGTAGQSVTLPVDYAYAEPTLLSEEESRFGGSYLNTVQNVEAGKALYVKTSDEFPAHVKNLTGNEVNFRLLGEDETVPAGVVTLTLDNDTKAGDDVAPYVVLSLNDTHNGTTMIERIEAATPAANEIYDLQGRRLAAPVKGINIINGRKVMM